MDFLVFCTFDLKNATSQDYANAYADLDTLGLKRVVKGSGGEAVIPTTSTMGLISGASAGSVRDEMSSKVEAAFKRRGRSFEIFLTAAGTDWAWGARSG